MDQPKYYKVCPNCRAPELVSAVFCGSCGKHFPKGLRARGVRRVRADGLVEIQVETGAPTLNVASEPEEVRLSPMVVVFVLALLPLAFVAARADLVPGRIATFLFALIAVGLLVFTSPGLSEWLRTRR